MAPNEFRFPRVRQFVERTSTLLVAIAFLLMSSGLAVFLAVQPFAGTATVTASQSPSATVVDVSQERTDPVTAAAPAVTEEAAPEDVRPPAADVAPPVEAVVSAPEPAPAPVDPAVSVRESNRYVVVAGDTVSAIASRFGVDVYAMLAANGLGVYSIILPGQTLKLTGPPIFVPAQAPAAPARAAAQTPVAAAPAQAAAAAPQAPAAPAVRTIYVAGSGGQSLVDACIGPIHFTPTDAYALFITEHDFCGGWARFSGIRVGETVKLSGFGTYKATGRAQVVQGGTTNDVAAAFGGFPRAVLQTCIPGTNQMLLIALN